MERTKLAAMVFEHMGRLDEPLRYRALQLAAAINDAAVAAEWERCANMSNGVKTNFRLVLPSAQPAVPALERRARLFLADGTEIFGVISYTVSGGDLDRDGLRLAARVTLEFDRDQFTVEG